MACSHDRAQFRVLLRRRLHRAALARRMRRCTSSPGHSVPRLAHSTSSGSSQRHGYTRQARAQEFECGMLRKVLALAGPTMAIFERAGLEPAFADDDAVRYAEQLGIGELDPGARVAIVVEHLDARGVELGIQRIGRGAYRAATCPD